MKAAIAEKRIRHRNRVLKAGKIAFNRGSVIDCMVRNRSETGALLQVVTPLEIPESFDLLVDGEIRPCMVVWRKDRQIGIEFQKAI